MNEWQPIETAPKDVTPEMIDAGIDVLLSFCPDTAAGDEVDRRMVAAIYTAMAAASPMTSECV